jgi:hypothetical protein
LYTNTVILAFVHLAASFLIGHSLPLALAIAATSRPTRLMCQLEKNKFLSHHSPTFVPKYVFIGHFTVAALNKGLDSGSGHFPPSLTIKITVSVPKSPSLLGQQFWTVDLQGRTQLVPIYREIPGVFFSLELSRHFFGL